MTSRGGSEPRAAPRAMATPDRTLAGPPRLRGRAAGPLASLDPAQRVASVGGPRADLLGDRGAPTRRDRSPRSGPRRGSGRGPVEGGPRAFATPSYSCSWPRSSWRKPFGSTVWTDGSPSGSSRVPGTAASQARGRIALGARDPGALDVAEQRGDGGDHAADRRGPGALLWPRPGPGSRERGRSFPWGSPLPSAES